MKKILCIYLSFSMAFMPLLSHAQEQVPAQGNVTALEQLMMSTVQDIDAGMMEKGVEVYAGNGVNKLSLADAINSKDFILDARKIDGGIFRVKSVSTDVTGRKIVVAVAILKDLKDTRSTQTTSFNLDISQPPKAMIENMKQSLADILAEDTEANLSESYKKERAAVRQQRMAGFIFGTLLLLCGLVAATGVGIGAAKLNKTKEDMLQMVVLGSSSAFIIFFAYTTFSHALEM